MAKKKIDPEKFHLALLAWSKKKGIPLRRIAEKMGVHPNSIYYYTKTRPDRTNVLPGLGKAAEIADVLHITLDELAKGPDGEGLRDE